MDWKGVFKTKSKVKNCWKTCNFELKSFQAHTNYVYFVALVDEYAYSCSADCLIKEYNTKTQQCTNIMKGHANDVSTFRCNETLLVSGSRDRTVKLWGNLRQPHQHKLLASLKSHEHTITCVQLAPSVVLSSSWDKTVKVWDIDHQSLLHTLRGHEDWIWVVQLADDNKTAVSASDDQTVRIWDIHNSVCAAIGREHQEPITTLQMEGDAIVTGSLDSTIRVWDKRRMDKSVFCLAEHHDAVSSFHMIYPKLVSGGADGGIKLVRSNQTRRVTLQWDVSTGNLEETIKSSSGDEIIWNVRQDDYKVVSGGTTNELFVWDLDSTEIMYSLSPVGSLPSQRVTWIHMSESQLLAGYYHGGVSLFDFSGKKEKRAKRSRRQ